MHLKASNCNRALQQNAVLVECAFFVILLNPFGVLLSHAAYDIQARHQIFLSPVP
jgi:hypothetical protein